MIKYLMSIIFVCMATFNSAVGAAEVDEFKLKFQNNTNHPLQMRTYITKNVMQLHPEDMIENLQMLGIGQIGVVLFTAEQLADFAGRALMVQVTVEGSLHTFGDQTDLLSPEMRKNYEIVREASDFFLHDEEGKITKIKPL